MDAGGTLGINYIGFNLEETIQPNKLFRVWITSEWFSAGVLNTSALQLGGGKAYYDKFYNVVHMIPTTQLSTTSDSKTAVFDVNLKIPMTGAQIIAALKANDNVNTKTTAIEMLSDDDAADSSSPAGAAQRAAAQVAAEKEAADNSIGKQISNAIAGASTVVKWAAAIAIIGALLYFGSPYLAHKKSD